MQYLIGYKPPKPDNIDLATQLEIIKAKVSEKGYVPIEVYKYAQAVLIESEKTLDELKTEFGVDWYVAENKEFKVVD
jgi:hypothetical protein